MAKKERKYIKIRGASEHNLKCVSLDIPRDEFVVFTGFQAPASHHWHLIPYMLRAAQVHGVTFIVCTSVFRTDGEAECGVYRGTSACHFH